MKESDRADEAGTAIASGAERGESGEGTGRFTRALEPEEAKSIMAAHEEAFRQRRLAIELDRAVGRLEADRVRELVAQGAGFYAEGNGGVSALWRALNLAHLQWGEDKKRCEEIFDVLLAAGADPNERGSHSESLLHGAAYLAEEGLARRLIEHGASVSAMDQEGDTPAHKLAANRDPLDNGAGDHVGLARVLALGGSDFKALNKAGESPIGLSLKRGHWALAEAMRAWEERRELSGDLSSKPSQSKPSL